MRWSQQFRTLAVFTALWAAAVLAELGDPYKILRLKRSATQQDIRKAYLKLAKEWHPDKSSDPSAESKFVEIKQSYELLSDVERRYNYDQKGITEENVNARAEYHQYHAPNPFEELFAQHGGRFNFQDSDITFFHKLSITIRQYDKTIIPRSQTVPHLIFFYTDWCFPCLQAAPYMRKLVEYLGPLGVNLVTVHSAREPNLARRLNVHSLPCLVLLLDGNAFVYKETGTSLQKIVEFIRKKLPYNLVQKVQDADVEEFLNGWEDNRVRGLIFEPRENIRLRYLITAYHFRDRVAFGFVDSEEIRRKYQVSNDMDTVLLFNENISRPIATVSMKDIPTSTLDQIISTHQYLALPRLSSQGILESLCPCEWNTRGKRLCVVLVTSNSDSHDPHREAFRTYAQNSPYNSDKVRFVYIYHDKQTEFVNSLMPDGESLEPILRIVIIWRRDTTHIKYEWVSDKWETQDNINDTTQKLENTLSRLLKSSEALTYEAFVKELFDEHAKGIFGRIITKLVMMTGSLYDSLDKEQLLPALSVLGTMIFIVILGYIMAYLVRLEAENVEKEKAKMNRGENNNDSLNGGGAGYQQELKLHELRSEKYNGLIRMLKPGCRTILLVMDMQSRQTLIPPFHKAVWPYRKNKTLMFSYMFVERGLSWYKELLELSLPEGRDLNINPRNCVGTVLALNGHRKYFCMFHAKHNERNKKFRALYKGVKKVDRDPEVGQFLGFDSDTTDSESDEVLLQGNLLDGLSNWLDRLFEGTTHRYHINYWPDFPNK